MYFLSSPAKLKTLLIIAALIFLSILALTAFMWVKSNSQMTAIKETGQVPETQPFASTLPSENTNQPSGTSQAQTLFTKLKVAIDDDPVMGDPSAKITIIEFSDFECPRCKKFFETALPELKKQYLDTGIAKLVYRDFPLDYHANSIKEAQAAECARDQGGDAVYFNYHDEIFKRTKSNGTGLPLSELPLIAGDLELDSVRFQQCLDSGKYESEVLKDLSDGKMAEVVGTPTFFIGRVNPGGEFEGMKLGGAYPFRTFQLIIDYQLKQLQQ